MNSPVSNSVIGAPDPEHAVCALDEAADVLVYQRTEVHADIGRLILVERGLAHEHSGEGQTGGVDHRLQGGLQTGSCDEDTRDYAGGARAFQHAPRMSSTAAPSIFGSLRGGAIGCASPCAG